jgi:hypothetical protein
MLASPAAEAAAAQTRAATTATAPNLIAEGRDDGLDDDALPRSDAAVAG